jgi:NADH-quinone oxidoreductase subunit J
VTGADVAFWILATISVSASLVVITNRNPVACVLFLVVAFFALAGLFVTLHSHFLAAIQVIIYAGAIMVLFLFVILLLNLGQQQWFDVSNNPLRVTAVVFGAGFLALLVGGGISGVTPTIRGPAAGISPDLLGSTGAIGAALYTAYFVPFVTIALLLLLAMVGAVAIARRER